MPQRPSIHCGGLGAPPCGRSPEADGGGAAHLHGGRQWRGRPYPPRQWGAGKGGEGRGGGGFFLDPGTLSILPLPCPFPINGGRARVWRGGLVDPRRHTYRTYPWGQSSPPTGRLLLRVRGRPCAPTHPHLRCSTAGGGLQVCTDLLTVQYVPTHRILFQSIPAACGGVGARATVPAVGRPARHWPRRQPRPGHPARRPHAPHPSASRGR